MASADRARLRNLLMATDPVSRASVESARAAAAARDAAAAVAAAVTCVACKRTDGPFEHTDKDTGLPLCLNCVDREDDPDPALKAGLLFSKRATSIFRLSLEPMSNTELARLTQTVPADLSEWLASKVPNLTYMDAVGRQFSKLVKQASLRAYNVISTQGLKYDAGQDAIDAYTKAFSDMFNFIVDNWNMRASLSQAQMAALENRAVSLRDAEIKQMYRPNHRTEDQFRAAGRAFGDQLEWALANSPNPTFVALAVDE